MTIKPILFNTEMVRAILDRRKSCTRRSVTTRRKAACGFYVTKKADGTFSEIYEYDENESMFDNPLMPPYQPGDIMYVRETFYEDVDCILYKADNEKLTGYRNMRGEDIVVKWRPSIHMPKEAARIWLRVTVVRVERLQEIDEDGVWDEGFRFKPPCLTRVSADGHTCDLDGPCTSSIKYCDMTMGELFGRELWNNTIKKSDLDRYGWDANPWVWVIEFERCEKPEGV